MSKKTSNTNDPNPRVCARGFFTRPEPQPRPRSFPPRSFSLGKFAVVLFLLGVVVGCSSGPRDFANENDRLREENMGLRDQVELLETQVEGLKTQLAVDAKSAGIRAGGEWVSTSGLKLVAPSCVRIQITKPSGGIDTNNDQLDDAVRVYLRTLDYRDRFVQTLASVSATVVTITPGEEALTLATLEIDPSTFDAGYRTGFGSTHYTLEIPLEAPPPASVSELTVRLKLHDVQSGADLETEQVLPFVGSAPTKATAPQ